MSSQSTLSVSTYLKNRESFSKELAGAGLKDYNNPECVGRGGGQHRSAIYSKLQKDLLKHGSLFVDDEFPATEDSIFYSYTPEKPFKWKRPTEICQNPKLFVDGACRFDIVQGELGDCWLLAAIAAIAGSKELVKRVVPNDQGFDKERYVGMFHFKFYRYGTWVEVIIDDRLPTYNNKLVFMHSQEDNEFWTALLEKAYAKLHGSYEALKGGNTCEAMVDFTGGISEIYELTEPADSKIYKIMLKAKLQSSLMGCNIESEEDGTECADRETVLENGLVIGHAYTITDVKLIKYQYHGETVNQQLVRLRNPWGDEHEWKGSWGDKSSEWKYLNDKQRQSMGLVFEGDGEFWMSFADFAKNFTKLEICHLSPDSMESGNGFRWDVSLFTGAWLSGCTAGGCRNFLKTFWTNPQYCIQLTDPDEDDDTNTCTMIVGLTQKDRRKQRAEGKDFLTIGFSIYKLKESQMKQPLKMEFFKYHQSSGRSKQFINLRDNNTRFTLEPGFYCIIPSTFEPNQNGKFILRVFTEKPAIAGQVDEVTDITEIAEPKMSKDQENKTKQLHKFFLQLAGEEMELDCKHVKKVLDYATELHFPYLKGKVQFSLDGCRGIIAVMDIDHTGRLGFDEFVALWKNICWWMTTFSEYDLEKQGSLQGYEIRQALNKHGLHISNIAIETLVLRYGQPDGTITFKDFMRIGIKVKFMMQKYKKLRSLGYIDSSLSEDNWIEMTMYC